MGTLHTSSAAKTIDRIIDVFPADDKEMVRAMLSVSLEAVIAQTLVKKADGAGRVAVHEIMLGTPAIRNLIREAKVPQITSMIQMGTKQGMCIMRDSMNKLYEQGLISAETLREGLMTGTEDESSSSGPLPMGGAGGARKSANSF
jgi:twitching motility protein PilT